MRTLMPQTGRADRALAAPEPAPAEALSLECLVAAAGHRFRRGPCRRTEASLAWLGVDHHHPCQAPGLRWYCMTEPTASGAACSGTQGTSYGECTNQAPFNYTFNGCEGLTGPLRPGLAAGGNGAPGSLINPCPNPNPAFTYQRGMNAVPQVWVTVMCVPCCQYVPCRVAHDMTS